MIGRVVILVLAACGATVFGYATSVELMPKRADCASLGCHFVIAGK
jgi:hypothetical protein